MLGQKAILIVEDNYFVALDISMAVEELNGEVVGPVETVDEALSLIDKYQISGAVLDCQLIDCEVTPIVMRLIDQGVPFVIHTGTGLPPALAEAHPDLPVLMKPIKTAKVLEVLVDKIVAHETAKSGTKPKLD